MTLCWWCASWRVIKRLGDLSAAPAFVDQKTTKFAHRKACPAQPLVWILKFIYKSYGYDNFLNFGNHAVGFCSQVYPPGYTCLVRNGVCPQIAYAFCTFSHEGHSYCRCKNPNFEKKFTKKWSNHKYSSPASSSAAVGKRTSALQGRRMGAGGCSDMTVSVSATSASV